MPTRVLLHLCLVAVIGSVPGAVSLSTEALASDFIKWGNSEPIDTGVSDVPSGSGASMVWLQDAWHLIYPKAGGVRYTWGRPGSWNTPLLLVPEGSGATNPHLSTALGNLILVWEDRSSTPRVVERHGWRSTWTEPLVLSPAGVVSRNPVPAGAGGVDNLALVAWEDSTSSGWVVRCRRYDGSWSPVETVPAVATESDSRDPSAAFAPRNGPTTISVAWADFRHGQPEIYERAWSTPGGWGAEHRRTDMLQGCRHPSISAGHWGDLGFPGEYISYEAAGSSGVVEIWSWGYSYGCNQPGLLSPDDGIPSVNPNSAAISIPVVSCGALPGGAIWPFTAWTDLNGPGTAHSVVRGCSGADTPDALPAFGDSRVALAINEDTPAALLLQMWISEGDGIPTLMAREGTTPGCDQQGLVGLTPVFIAPGGLPATVLLGEERCSHAPVPGLFVQLSLAGVADQLTWDPEQTQDLFGETDSEGELAFEIRGGGCAMGGVVAYAGIWCRLDYEGVKSPDVDGDCAVRQNDLEYVQGRLGSADFCADLDGSGQVGPEDVALVEATMGDRCSHITDAPEVESVGGPALASRLVAWPNPCSDQVRLRLAGPAPGARVEIAMVDAGGRRVRSLSATPSTYSSAEGTWDLADDAGRPVPSGCYFALVRRAGQVLRVPVLVVR